MAPFSFGINTILTFFSGWRRPIDLSHLQIVVFEFSFGQTTQRSGPIHLRHGFTGTALLYVSDRLFGFERFGRGHRTFQVITKQLKFNV
jgi:hypothetical protein